MRVDRMARDSRLTFAFARICGGMILSGPKACRGSTKEVRILPAFVHSPVAVGEQRSAMSCGQNNTRNTRHRTLQRRRQRVVDLKRHRGEVTKRGGCGVGSGSRRANVREEVQSAARSKQTVQSVVRFDVTSRHRHARDCL